MAINYILKDLHTNKRGMAEIYTQILLLSYLIYIYTLCFARLRFKPPRRVVRKNLIRCRTRAPKRQKGTPLIKTVAIGTVYLSSGALRSRLFKGHLCPVSIVLFLKSIILLPRFHQMCTLFITHKYTVLLDVFRYINSIIVLNCIT